MKNKKRTQALLLGLVAVIVIIIIVIIALLGQENEDAPKVGLVITGSIDDDGWNGVHYQGVLYACDKIGTELLVKENVSEEGAECQKAIEELVEEGASMIILSSYGYPTIAKETIDRYPDVAFYGISAEYYADNMTSYFGRMYQARYLAGVLAGLKTENDNIGYVAAMANNEVNRGINAFTMGVKSVNPEASVNVIWTGSWDDKEKEVSATNTLIKEKNVDVITYHQNQPNVAITADAAGVYTIGYNEQAEGLSEKYLTAAVWDWKKLYYQIVREFVQGEANNVKRHWFGIDTEVVKLSEYSSYVTEEEKQAVAQAMENVFAGMDIFSGKIYDNNGELRCDDGESISDDILLEKMDWYVDGVVIYGK
ncbi:MAG: BMP family ABC transporter substrate-binding protein [Lachnospiraceae bacterium]|nr:BMP family ABC transporter substrate-binding protein [Lachnospiraceae bacterium]